MNKKAAVLGIGFVLGSTMLLTSAYAGVTKTEGYDALKQAVKTTMKAESVTAAWDITVRDNGNAVVEVDASGKLDRKQEAASAAVSVTSGGQQTALNVYHTKDQTVLNTPGNDTYTVIENNAAEHKFQGKSEQRREHNPEFAQELENVVDTLVGNLKHYVNVNQDTNGQQTIEMDLKEAQIPAVVRAAGSLAIKAASQHDGSENEFRNHPEFPGVSIPADVHKQLPKLTKDISIDRFQLQANVDANGYITGKTAVLTITGKDASDTAHEVVIECSTLLSGYNQTVPDTVDLTDKQVKTLDMEALKAEHHQ